MQEEVGGGIVIIETQNGSPRHFRFDGTGEKLLHTQAVSLLLDQIPVELEVDRHGARAVYGKVVAATDPVVPAVGFRNAPTGFAERARGADDLRRMQQEIDVVQRPLVEPPVETVERIAPLEENGADARGLESIQGLFEPRQ
jgi:hypothetical protein